MTCKAMNLTASPHRALLALVLLGGFVVRLPHIADPPLRFHATRQYHSFILARSYYLPWSRNLTVEELDAARAAASSQAPIEPPVMEHLAAWIYRAAGREALWIPRLLSVLAWTGGGVAMWWLAASLLSPPAAVAAVALFMFLPFGIIASQAFQPDPLMTGLTVLGLATGLHHHKHPGVGTSLLFLSAATLAVLIKPMAGFLLGPAAVVLAVQRGGLIRGVRFATISTIAMMLPAVAYYRYGTENRLQGRFFYPHLLGEPSFWRNWAAMLDSVAGWPFVFAALAGVALTSRSVRSLLLGLWCGYVLLGCVFAYHIYTHNYYSLPLLPVIAVSAAALVDAVGRAVRSKTLRKGLVAMAVLALIAGAGLASRAAGVFQSAADLHAEVARYQRIGEAVRHSTSVASLDSTSYGFAINYHGLISSSNLPLSGDLALSGLSGQPAVSSAERLDGLKNVDFFVATSPVELELQPDLRAFLDTRLPIARDGPPDNWLFVVYDLKRAGMTVDPKRIVLLPGSPQSVHLRTLPAARWRVENPIPELFDVLPSEGSGPGTVSIVPRSLPFEVDKSLEVPIYTGENRSPFGQFTVRIKSNPDPSLGDYDGDGKADLVVYRPTDAKWYSLPSSNHFTNGRAIAFGVNGDVPVPGDFDGDGKNDLAVYRPASTTWFVLQSSTGMTVSHQLGGQTDILVPGDYDGDGKIDVAVYRPTTGVWSILESSKNDRAPLTFTMGLRTDIPVPGDYDGDRKSDVAIFRPSTGTWHIMGSRPSSRIAVAQWGLAGDIPVPGDYNGDGKTDLAVYRPSSSRWYIWQTRYDLQFGLGGDIPVPGDYDGDGKTDVAVFRPATGTWFILKSSTWFTETTSVQWGLAGDIPALRKPVGKGAGD
jgi:hypothetical protein